MSNHDKAIEVACASYDESASRDIPNVRAEDMRRAIAAFLRAQSERYRDVNTLTLIWCRETADQLESDNVG